MPCCPKCGIGRKDLATPCAICGHSSKSGSIEKSNSLAEPNARTELNMGISSVKESISRKTQNTKQSFANHSNLVKIISTIAVALIIGSGIYLKWKHQQNKPRFISKKNNSALLCDFF